MLQWGCGHLTPPGRDVSKPPPAATAAVKATAPWCMGCSQSLCNTGLSRGDYPWFITMQSDVKFCDALDYSWSFSRCLCVRVGYLVTPKHEEAVCGSALNVVATQLPMAVCVKRSPIIVALCIETGRRNVHFTKAHALFSACF